MKDRMYIITDSLGCPREEISIEKTWTEGILQKWSDHYTIYTQCVRGQSLRSVIPEYILDYKPTIIIIQMGIVDAARRVLSPFEQDFISVVFRRYSEKIRNFISKRHYKLTKKRNYRYFSLLGYERFFHELINKSDTKIVIIPIAPPGKYLIQQTFNIENDVKDFNNFFKLLQNNNSDRVFLVDAYKNMKKIDDYVLEDGHHLNEKGNEILLHECDKIIDFITE